MLSAWALGGIALMIGAALVLVYPRRTLIDQVQRARGNDPLTLAYLTNLVKTEPRNAELRVLLAEKKFAAGEVEEARELLELLQGSTDEAIRRRALLLSYHMLETETFARAPGNFERRAAHERLVLALRTLAARPWPARDLLDFARKANTLGETRLAGELYARLVASGEMLEPQWLEAVSRAELGAGNYSAAADLLFALQARASSREEKRDYFRRAVTTLQSGNLLDAALQAADQHIGELADDDETLQFLAQLALAANDPARAARYMRRLLRMSWLERLRMALAQLPPAWIASAHAAQEDAPRPAPPGMRPYDEKLYKLAYDIFLANRNLDDAYKVADAAVRQVPADAAWRERLAQVSEWTGKPAEALQQWLYLARHTDADKALQAVLRLAPGLHDDEALLYAWQQSAKKRKPDAAQWRAIADLYERLGRPLDAVAYFEAAYAKNADPVLPELMARLEERAGRLDEAIRQYRRLIGLVGDTPERAARLATLYLLKADFRQAYAVLEPMRERASPAYVEYWNLLADLAWQLQQDDAALQAYGVKVARPDAKAADAQRLVQLMRSRAPEEAARLAESLYRRLGSPGLLIAAAEIHWQRRDLVALKRLYAGLTPADEARLATNAYFFTLRASYYQASGQGRTALADYERALAIAPANADLRTGLLWLLIDLRSRDELRRRLQAWQAEAAGNQAYWAPYAAGWMSLAEPRRALPWYARELKTKRGDYLWLLNYADALEQAGEATMAWRVRRHAWAQAHQPDGAPPTAARNREAMLAYARLATQLAPGDASLAVMRHLLRQGQESAQPLDAASKELVLSWMLSTEQNEAARAWLWQQYGRSLARPAWAELAVALAQNDGVTLERLLATQADALPPASRIDAARALRDVRLAQSYVFEALEQAPHDDELHLRLVTETLSTANSVSVQDTAFTRGELKGRERTLALDLWNTPRLRLSARLSTVRQSAQDAGTLPGVPGFERQTGLSALLRHERGDTEIGIAQRSALTQFNSLRLEHTERWAEGVSSNFGLTRHERADETIPLGLGGHRDRVFANLNYAFSKREYLSAGAWWADYHTQGGHGLGTGRGFNYELGHRLRIEYPDLTLRYSGAMQSYNPAALADAMSSRFTADGSIPPGSFFLPQDFKLQGINLGLGSSARDAYTRALRPYADLGRSYNTLSGNGYNWRLGAAGSVLGPDNLSVYFTRSRGGSGINIEVREFGLRYKYFFDRY